MVINISVISKPNEIITTRIAAIELQLKHDTYIFRLIDKDKIDITYPFPDDTDPESGPMFVVVNDKYKLLKIVREDKIKKKKTKTKKK